MKNIRLYTFAVLFAHLPTPEKIIVYMKSRDELATSDVKLSSRIQKNRNFEIEIELDLYFFGILLEGCFVSIKFLIQLIKDYIYNVFIRDGSIFTESGKIQNSVQTNPVHR